MAVTIPGGTVSVGDEAIAVAPFRIDRAVVTQAEYAEYTLAVAAMPPRLSGDPSAPAVFLTASEAAGFARWRGGRLPTDAEWQRAALHIDGVSAFGLEGLGQVWELTATKNVVRGGCWRDRPGEPARLENRSTEVNPARDVGFRCAYPLEPGQAARDHRRRLGVRDAKQRERLARLFTSEAGLGAYLAQELTRVGLAFQTHRRSALPMVDLRVEAIRSGNMLEALAKYSDNADDVTIPTKLAFRWGDMQYFGMYAEHGHLLITHSTQTGGIDPSMQHVMYGETLTRIPLETFVKLTYDASDFIRHVMDHFEGCYDSPT